MANDPISRADAIDVLETGAEFLRLALDDMDVVRSDREKFAWGLGLIETFIADIKELPSAEPEIIYCKDCVKHNKCKFYQTQGDNGYCRYGRSKDGRLNPQKRCD